MPSLPNRIASSFKSSFADIVFGMEDGTVSIFGLVFGVAASTGDTRVVLVAGMTGAIAAAVSMMAGAYLDAETARDQARAFDADHDPQTFEAKAIAVQLRDKGIAPEALAALASVARAYPGLPGALRAAYRAKAERAEGSPLAHALWMLVSDLLAALVPVLPFAFLPMETARYVSLAATTAVLVVLGVGRAKIGKRRLLPTTLQTLGIAAAAGLAGVLVGNYFA